MARKHPDATHMIHIPRHSKEPLLIETAPGSPLATSLQFSCASPPSAAVQLLPVPSFPCDAAVAPDVPHDLLPGQTADQLSGLSAD